MPFDSSAQAALSRFPLRGKRLRSAVPPLPTKAEGRFRGGPEICLEGNVNYAF